MWYIVRLDSSRVATLVKVRSGTLVSSGDWSQVELYTSIYYDFTANESPGSLGSAHSTLSVWKTPLGSFALTGYDQQFGSCYLCLLAANIRDNRRDDSCEVATYFNQCLQLAVQLCTRKKHRCL